MTTTPYLPEPRVSRDRESPAERRARFEREAFQHRTALHATALQITRNATDAEDLLQDSYTRAYASFDQFQPGTNFAAWVKRIMKNEYVSACRRRQCRPHQVLIPELGEGQLTRLAGFSPDTARSAEADALERLPDSDVKEALRAIPPARRLAVYLADVEGFSYLEVAETMGTPVGTVMSRIHRGRRQLRALLPQYAPGRRTL
ncbi:sigma-70 family RNA polymerase sigma factor [Streptomyces sp. 049-1]|uniref:sigma-70 family RNA polymerase sigma factor n=1 Tax=Streptomyces sp. 049-1 TaxID=2789264 RepID=UPI00397FA576